jgi:hypothetical protein
VGYLNERSGVSGLGCGTCRGGMDGMRGLGCCAACMGRQGMAGITDYGDLAWKVTALSSRPYGFDVSLKQVKKGFLSDDDTGVTATDTWPSWAGTPPGPGDPWPGAPDQPASDPYQSPASSGPAWSQPGAAPSGPSVASQLFGLIPGLFQAAGSAAGQILRPRAPVATSTSSGSSTDLLAGAALLAAAVGVGLAVKSRRGGRGRRR